MHDCLNCGCACYCHGDIDDCQVETAEYAALMCDGCGCHEDRIFDDDEPFPICPHGSRLAECETCDEEIGDIDKCLDCGRYYGPHAGLKAWPGPGVAPQRCFRCWKQCGDPLPLELQDPSP